ncbi:MAG TPA: class I SAM-dependent methyltransferase [Spirochaetota bacterium]|nr:class I SAM-dependent methyltransferase [Spirochaetota bacterium]
MICPFCQSDKILKKLRVYSEILKKERVCSVCKKCGSINQDTTPSESEIKEYYEAYEEIKGEMNPGYLSDDQLISFFRERDKTLKEIGFPISSIIQGANVELGCANGQFLRYLKNKNANNIVGIDISKKLIESVNLEGVKLINGDFTKIDDNAVDNLFMFNVLEHIPLINDTIAQILRITKDNSNIIIEVPIAGFISGFFNEKWRFLMPDEHLHIPSVKGLKALLSRYDLFILGFTRFGSGYTAGSINPKFKEIFDLLAKKTKIGDRGAFLIKKTKK